MTMNLYSVYDRAAGIYNAPFMAHSDRDAIRSFTLAMQNAPADTPQSTNPGDFELFRVGSYDQNAGLLFSETPVIMIFRALDIRPAVDPSREGSSTQE